MFYSDDIIEDVRSRNDIVDVISSYVKLKKTGATYFGLCPFHNEKSPSFSVSPSKQMFYCFGCHEGGNVFSFVMKYENFSFTEAVKFLADKANINLPEGEYTDEERRRADLKAQLQSINKEAALYYFHQLKSPNGRIAMEYLKNRGLADEVITHFGLGYSNKTSDDLYRYFKEKGYSDDVLKETGLFSFSEKGTYDKFWNRVMFPIMDINNKVIGFGGRVMGEGKPKYLNSPETKIFEKSRNLYGMNFARTSRKTFMLICEGYMDVIALHKAGFTNAVAALGTAFSEFHAQLIKRYAKSVVLTFDSDLAGKNAALRAIPILKKTGMKIKVLDMTPYKDPDEFIKNLGSDEYQKRIDSAKDSFIFEIEMMKSEFNLSEVREKADFYNKTAHKLLEFSNELERNVYLQEVSSIFGIPEEDLRSMVKKLALNYTGPEVVEEKFEINKNVLREKNTDNGIIKAQKMILTWLIEDGKIYGKIKNYINSDDFIDPLYNKVANMLFEQLQNGQVNPARILNDFHDEDEHKKAAELFNTPLRDGMNVTEKEMTINDLVRVVKKNSLDYREKQVTDIKELQEIIKERSNLQKINISL
ncbi:MAG: DNA primase [Lachnospiraceae bacterium]|nr:DNA primase [Lachnospiraceae bacterium]